MKKLVSLISMIVISLVFSIATSGCGGNRNQYFVETDEIMEVENNAEIEIKELFVEKEPEVYQPETYKSIKELEIIEQMDLNDYRIELIMPTSFGWSLLTINKITQEQNIKDIVIDESKYHKFPVLPGIFDINNNLSYFVTFRNTTLHCIQQTKQEQKESWKMKLLNKSGMYICNNLVDSNIITYRTNEIMIIDTKTATINRHYKLPRYSIIYIIPKNDYLWVFASNQMLLSGAINKSVLNPIVVFTINIKNGDVLKFEKLTSKVKVSNDSIVLNRQDEIYKINCQLDVEKITITDIHKDAHISDVMSKFASIESGILTFNLNNKEYILDIDEPSRLHELPIDLKTFNSKNFSSDNWKSDYYLLENGYCYGYDVDKHEKTWRIKTNKTPLYSTENGVFFIENNVITIYGEKK